jgi:hypothetical protein
MLVRLCQFLHLLMNTIPIRQCVLRKHQLARKCVSGWSLVSLLG